MDSILTSDKENCFFCGAPACCVHHLVFGNPRREFSENSGLKVPSCARCHTYGDLIYTIHGNIMAEKMSKIIGQLAWEKEAISKGETPQDARERFRRECGKSYL